MFDLTSHCFTLSFESRFSDVFERGTRGFDPHLVPSLRGSSSEMISR